MTRLAAVPIASIELAWVSALPLIQKIADSAPDLTITILWRMVRSGEAELWLAGEGVTHEAAGITKMKDWGGQTAALIIGVASTDGRAWRSVIPEFKQALKARGADIIIMEGRAGWARVFPGAKVVRQTYEVKL